MFRRRRRWTIAAVSEDQTVTFEMIWRLRYRDEAEVRVAKMNAQNKNRAVTYVVWDREGGCPFPATD